jgi:Rieske Fe-S protein
MLKHGKELILGTEMKQKKTRRAFLGNLVDRFMMFGFVSSGLCKLGFSFQDNKSAVLATIKIADNPGLGKVGGFVLIKGTPAGELLIVRSGNEQFDAMSNVCPHKQCHVEVKSPTLIKCPCHGSTYQIDGAYVSGPSKKSLKKFRVTTDGGVISVTAG